MGTDTKYGSMLVGGGSGLITGINLFGQSVKEIATYTPSFTGIEQPLYNMEGEVVARRLVSHGHIRPHFSSMKIAHRFPSLKSVLGFSALFGVGLGIFLEWASSSPKPKWDQMLWAGINGGVGGAAGGLASLAATHISLALVGGTLIGAGVGLVASIAAGAYVGQKISDELEEWKNKTI